jgi:hypothetical protein
MMLAGLMVLVGAVALQLRGFSKLAALLGLLACVLLILGRPVPSVADVVKKGRKS